MPFAIRTTSRFCGFEASRISPRAVLDLAAVAGGNPSGAEPRYQLAGSAYDRTLYGFRIATRPDQDDALIRTLNASPNEESYKLLRRNCADFFQADHQLLLPARGAS
jgi:hypothetical protein